MLWCLAKASRSSFSEPSKARETLLPAFSDSCEMENSKYLNRLLQRIQDSDRRQGERNQRIFLITSGLQTTQS